MPQQPFRTRSLRRVKIRTPGGKLKISYRQRKPSKAKCMICKKQLPGIPREIPVKLKKLSRTQKRPSRPYAGMLCSSCMRRKIIEKARQEK